MDWDSMEYKNNIIKHIPCLLVSWGVLLRENNKMRIIYAFINIFLCTLQIIITIIINNICFRSTFGP